MIVELEGKVEKLKFQCDELKDGKAADNRFFRS